MTLRDLARKDVIRLSNGENLGRIDDIEFEEICPPYRCGAAWSQPLPGAVGKRR